MFEKGATGWFWFETWVLPNFPTGSYYQLAGMALAFWLATRREGWLWATTYNY